MWRPSFFLISLTLFFWEGCHAVLSWDLNADQWVLSLVHKESVYAVSSFAPDPLYSFYSSRAQGLKIHHRELEMLLDPKIKVVVATEPFPAYLKRFLHRRRIHLILLGTPTTLEQTDASFRKFRALLEDYLGMRLTPPQLPTHRRQPALGPGLGVIYGQGGLCPGPSHFLQDALRKGGFRPYSVSGMKGWYLIDNETLMWLAGATLFLLDEGGPIPFSRVPSLRKKLPVVPLPLRLTLTPHPVITRFLILHITAHGKKL